MTISLILNYCKKSKPLKTISIINHDYTKANFNFSPTVMLLRMYERTLFLIFINEMLEMIYKLLKCILYCNTM